MKLIRYTDDFVVMVHGSRRDEEALYEEITEVLAPAGLKLSGEKTHITHVDDGFDFLGWHIRRRKKKGTNDKMVVHTYPSKKSVASIKDKIRRATRRFLHRTLADLLRRLNPILRGWCAYFCHGVSKAIFSYIDYFAFWRVVGWLKKRHPKLNVHTVVRRFLPGWHIAADGVEMFRPREVKIVRYRYRGNSIPNPWVYQTSE